MSIKVLTTGDIHIGKSSSGLKRSDAAMATKETWSRIVDYAIAHGVDVVALSGDIVDRDNRYFEAIGPFQRGFERLKQAGIFLYMVAGNHDFDVLPQLVDPQRYDNVRFLGAKGEWESDLFIKGEEKLQFVGWSFPDAHVTNDPLTLFNSTNIDPNIPAVALLHCDAGLRESIYAPVPIDSFRESRIDVWVLGHIHKPQILIEKEPLVYYPGSPHALSAKEQGVHGAVVLTIHSRTEIERKIIPLSPVRYETIEIDVTGREQKEHVRDVITSELFEDVQSKPPQELDGVSYLVYDVTLVGEHISIPDLKNWTVDLVEDYEQRVGSSEVCVWVRNLTIDVTPGVENMDELAKDNSPIGLLAKTIVALEKGEDDTFVNALLADWETAYADIVGSGVYHPLRARQADEVDNMREVQVGVDTKDEAAAGKEKAKHYLLKECRQILTELLNSNKAT